MSSPAGIKTTALLDIVVSLVSVPLLVIFSILLESNMRGDWTIDEEKRWNVFGLGLGLLFVSLMVCCYVTHRLGFCIWKSHNRRDRRSRPAHDRVATVTSSTDSHLNLVVNGELPPSYDSVVDSSTPPPSYYNTLVIKSEPKTDNDKIPTVSQMIHER